MAQTEYDDAGIHRHSVARAVLSATIFGSLGALLGRWLGTHGNDPQSKLARPIMQWSMGIFCGTLGAYSSFKASDEIAAARRNAYVSTVNEGDAVTLDAAQENLVSAAGKADVSTIKHQGKVAQRSHHVALEK